MTLFSAKSTSVSDLLLLNGLSLVLIAAIIAVPDSPLRVVLGVPFVLFFPGYTLISALFPAKLDLGGIERIALSIGSSLAVVPLVGLALNYTPWGIRLVPIIASLFLFTSLLSLLAVYRRKLLTVEQRFSVNLPISPPRLAGMRRFDKFFIGFIILSLVAVGGFTAYLGVSPKVGENFTEFYILGSNSQLADYPVNLTLGQKGVILLGITNREGQNMTYRITISLDNQTLTTINNIRMQNGVNWNQTYTFTPCQTGENLKLKFELYKEDIEEPYRNLQLLVTVRPSE